MSLGNPYIVDRPLDAEPLNASRYKLLTRVIQWLRRGRQAVLVFGSQRMGKTTFVRHLQPELSSEFALASLDWLWHGDTEADDTLPTVQASLLQCIGTALQRPLRTLEDVPSDQPVLVLVEGLSALDLCREPPAGLLRSWLEWVQSVPNVHLVISVNGSASGSATCAAAVSSLPYVELEGLTLDETEDTLLKPVRGRMAYNYDAVRRIGQLTAGQPYLVQLFGYVLFEAHGGRGRIEINDVEKSVAQVVTACTEPMAAVWQGCSPAAQVLLTVAADLQGRHGVFTVRDLLDAARLRGLTLTSDTTAAGLSELTTIGLLHSLSADSYEFSSYLTRLWVAQFKSLDQTLDHLKDQKQLFAPQNTWLGQSLNWGDLRVWLVGLALVTGVTVLWNLRGSAQRQTIGSSITPTVQVIEPIGTLEVGAALGRIAYMAKDKPDDTWDVWTMRGDGTDPRRLTDNQANDMTPTWSPDGKYLAFVSDRDGNKEIYVMKVDGTQQLNLTHEPAEDWTPAWSPDGASIAFSSYRDGNWEIYVMGADGSRPQRLTHNTTADIAPSWSSDGQRLVFNSNRDGNWELYVMQRDGTVQERLASDDATDSAPAWSLDGTTIAFETYRDGDMEIYLIAADGSDAHDISNDHYSNEHAPAWARGGTRILYHSNRDGGWDIFSMRPDGTEKTNLTLSSALEQNPVWHE